MGTVRLQQLTPSTYSAPGSIERPRISPSQRPVTSELTCWCSSAGSSQGLGVTGMNREGNKALMTRVLPLTDPESSPVTTPSPDLLVHSGQQRLPPTAPRQGLCAKPLRALTTVLGQGHVLSHTSLSSLLYHLNLKLRKSLCCLDFSTIRLGLKIKTTTG